MGWIWQNFYTASWLTVVITSLYYLIRVTAFVVTAFGLQRMATKRRMLYPWMAWIPVIRHYLLGQLVGQTLLVSPRLRIPLISYFLPFLSAFMILLSGTVAGNLAMVLTILLVTLCYCSLFRQYREPRAILYGLMAGLPYIEIIGCFLIWHLSGQPSPDPQADATVFRPRHH